MRNYSSLALTVGSFITLSMSPLVAFEYDDYEEDYFSNVAPNDYYAAAESAKPEEKAVSKEQEKPEEKPKSQNHEENGEEKKTDCPTDSAPKA
ncbi:MAG: hypothetical protein K0S07_1521 [Chlamydiales bacterium]|jgi:hypothetical protein|nr:hypothetical protein [Chlamydiales bacterium]